MPDSDVSLGLFLHSSILYPSNCNTISLHFWLQVSGHDLSPIPFYHQTVALSLPFRPKWTLHLRCWQFTCLHLVRALCMAKAKCQDSERGGNFSTQISFHLWYQSTSLTRVKWDFGKEIFEQPLKLKHGNTKTRLWLCNSLWHTRKKVHIWAQTKRDTRREHLRIQCHSTLKINPLRNVFLLKESLLPSIKLMLLCSVASRWCYLACLDTASSRFRTTLSLPQTTHWLT